MLLAAVAVAAGVKAAERRVCLRPEAAPAATAPAALIRGPSVSHHAGGRRWPAVAEQQQRYDVEGMVLLSPGLVELRGTEIGAMLKSVMAVVELPAEATKHSQPCCLCGDGSLTGECAHCSHFGLGSNGSSLGVSPAPASPGMLPAAGQAGWHWPHRRTPAPPVPAPVAEAQTHRRVQRWVRMRDSAHMDTFAS
eukprot:1158835-Pelagomonas_calceolata.AAC.3